MTAPQAEDPTDHLFRHKYGEILSMLVRSFGQRHFDLAEEAVQTAFRKAVETWKVSGTPQNPAGWLYTVARHSILGTLRSREAERRGHDRLIMEADRSVSQPDPVELDEEIEKEAVSRMILLCCNPDLGGRAQVALTLKSVCGLSVAEIARLMGMKDEAVKKMLTRARQSIADERDVFEDLDVGKIRARFMNVMNILYAMFTEGYSAGSGDSHLRYEIAEEAIRLTSLLISSPFSPEERRGDLHALRSLMLLQFSRFNARTAPDGSAVRLQDQDRHAWDRSMISGGMQALDASRASPNVTSYHIEARIAAAHSLAATFDDTPWSDIFSLYDQLLRIKDTIEVRLNRIVAQRYVHGPGKAMSELDSLADAIDAAGELTVMRSYVLHSLRAELLDAVGSPGKAREQWAEAAEKAPNLGEKKLIENRLKKDV